MDVACLPRPHPHCGKRAATPVTIRAAYRARQAYRGYWRVLTCPGSWSLILQAVWLIAQLLTVQGLGQRDVHDDFLGKLPSELADLAKFQLIWWAWCEQLYSLRRSFQPTHTMNC